MIGNPGLSLTTGCGNSDCEVKLVELVIFRVGYSPVCTTTKVLEEFGSNSAAILCWAGYCPVFLRYRVLSRAG